jgi:hypothetical protein
MALLIKWAAILWLLARNICHTLPLPLHMPIPASALTQFGTCLFQNFFPLAFITLILVTKLSHSCPAPQIRPINRVPSPLDRHQRCWRHSTILRLPWPLYQSAVLSNFQIDGHATILNEDPELRSPRGKAVLWLFWTKSIRDNETALC